MEISELNYKNSEDFIGYLVDKRGCKESSLILISNDKDFKKAIVESEKSYLVNMLIGWNFSKPVSSIRGLTFALSCLKEVEEEDNYFRPYSELSDVLLKKKLTIVLEGLTVEQKNYMEMFLKDKKYSSIDIHFAKIG